MDGWIKLIKSTWLSVLISFEFQWSALFTSQILWRIYEAKEGIPGGPPANSINIVSNLKKGLAAWVKK